MIKKYIILVLRGIGRRLLPKCPSCNCGLLPSLTKDHEDRICPECGTSLYKPGTRVYLVRFSTLLIVFVGPMLFFPIFGLSRLIVLLSFCAAVVFYFKMTKYLVKLE